MEKAYLANGAEVQVLHHLPDIGYVVQEFWSNDDDEPTKSDPKIVSKVYTEPPTQRIAEQIKQAEQRLEKLRNELTQVTHDLVDATAKREAVMAKAGQTEALQRVIDFTEGKYTHLVCKSSDWNIRLYDKKTALTKDSDSWPAYPRLISLEGRSNGDLAWMIHEGSTPHSGVRYEVHLVRSEAEGRELVRKLVDDYVRSDVKQLGQYFSNIRDSLIRLEMAVPREITDHLDSQELLAAETKLDNARRYERQADEELKALRAKTAAAAAPKS